MIHVFLSWFEPFRVRVSMDFAGVREERREERETLQKMRGTGLETFYIRRWNRVGFDLIQRPMPWTV